MTSPRTDASHDQNFNSTILGVSTSDGTTPVPVEANPSTGALLVETVTSGTSQVELTDGTNIANVVAGDTGFNGVATAGATKTYTFTTSASGAQTILANTQTEGFSWIEVVYTSVGSGLALQGQFSTISGGTYVNSSQFASQSNTITSLGTTVGTIYYGPIRGNFFQIAVSALTSGTFAGTVTLRAFAPPLIVSNVAQSGTWTVGSNSATGSAVPTNAFYIGINNGGNLASPVTSADSSDATSTTSNALLLRVMAEGSNFNGTSWDRQRSANGASNTTGTGLLGTGILGFDGTNYQRLGATAADSTTTGTSGISQLVSGTGFTTGTISLSAGTQNTNWYDLLNYPYISVEVLTNTTPATLTFQTSGDTSQTNVRTTTLTDSAAGQAGSNASVGIVSTTSALGTFFGARTGRYFRISSNLAGGNTATLVITFYTTALTPNVVGVNPISTTGTAVPVTAYYIGVKNTTGNLTGVLDVSLADGQLGGALPVWLYNGSTADRARSGGVTGMAGVSLQASPSGGYSFLHIAAGQATTTVKSGAGTLHAIIFNSAATATNTTTIYDNTAASGTVIGIPAATAVTTPESVIYDLAFATGLTIITATANGSDMTIIYK